MWKMAGLDVSHLVYITLQSTDVQLLFLSEDKGFFRNLVTRLLIKKKAKPGNHF